MRIEELVNQHYNNLNENDLMIWNYIINHKNECCNISIEELSKKCNISRATISRFTQKISFEGFREFKMRLKLEWEQDGIKNNLLADEISRNYVKSIELINDTDLKDVCSRIYNAKRLFAFGTGEVQNSAAKMIKRMFANAKTFFITLHGKNELMMAIDNLEEEDLVIIISLSGENTLAVEAVKRLRSKGVYVVSITKLSDNTLARYANKSLYIMASELMKIGGVYLEACSSYFNVVELLFVNYILYLQNECAN